MRNRSSIRMVQCVLTPWSTRPKINPKLERVWWNQQLDLQLQGCGFESTKLTADFTMTTSFLDFYNSLDVKPMFVWERFAFATLCLYPLVGVCQIPLTKRSSKQTWMGFEPTTPVFFYTELKCVFSFLFLKYCFNKSCCLLEIYGKFYFITALYTSCYLKTMW